MTTSPEGAQATSLCTVFGGTGFLGSAVVRAMCAAEYSVRVAARGATAAALEGVDGRVEPVTADVRDERSVRQAVRGARVVVNAVSLYAEKADATFEQIHVEGAARVARAAREGGVETLVQISGLGADTGSPSKYVRARGRGESAVREVFSAAVLLRPSVLFGRGGDFLASLAVATRLPVVPLFGDGRTRLQPVHVDDVAAAVAAVAGAPPPGSATAPVNGRPPGRVYELGGAETLTYRRIVHLVMDRLGRRRPVVPVPFAIWLGMARLLEPLPSPPFTRDQVMLMQHDNVVTGTEPTFAELGIEPAAFSALLARCL